MFVLADGDFKERFTQKFSDLVHLRSSSLLGVPIFLPFQVATSASPYSSLIQIMQIRQVLLLIFDIFFWTYLYDMLLQANHQRKPIHTLHLVTQRKQQLLLVQE